MNLLHDGTANTLSFWFKKTTAETNDVRTVLHSSDGSGNGFEVFYLDRSSSSEDRKIKIEVVNTSGQQVGIYYAQQAFPNDTDWHHYTIVSDVTNSILKLYVDGVEKTADSSYPTFTGSATTGDSISPFHIGKRATSNNFFIDGQFDEMSFWSKILSASEVSTLYNSGSANTPSSISTNGLTTYYNFEQTGIIH